MQSPPVLVIEMHIEQPGLVAWCCGGLGTCLRVLEGCILPTPELMSSLSRISKEGGEKTINRCIKLSAEDRGNKA